MSYLIGIVVGGILGAALGHYSFYVMWRYKTIEKMKTDPSWKGKHVRVKEFTWGYF